MPTGVVGESYGSNVNQGPRQNSPENFNNFKSSRRLADDADKGFVKSVLHFIDKVRLEQGEGGNVQDATTSTHNSSSNRETVGRAKDSSPPQLGDSIHSLATQLLGSRYYDSGLENTESANDDSMVEEDIRTPPKLKSQLHKYKNSHKPVVATASVDFAEDKGTKGVAVPVIIDEDDDLEKTMERLSGVQSESTQWQSTTPKRKYMESTSTRKPRPTTTTTKPNHESTASDESSTWILLSESSPPTTPSFNKRRKTPSSTTQRITTAHSEPELLQTSASYSLASSSFNHNIKKPQRLTATTTTASPNVKATRLPSSENNAHSSDRVAESSNSSPVENSKPGLLTGNSNNRNNSNIPNRTRKPVVQAVNNKVKPTTNTPNPELGTTRHRPVQQKMTITSRPPTTTTTLKLPEITTPIAAVEEEVTTAMEMVEEHSETTTKRSRRPQHSSEDNKKRKKNKNRRRRPTKRPSNDDLESKTADNNTTSSNTNQKIATKERPLTTRIYNYLAREVMPSFGVGLLGLVVTAGLAGLIMYPFGGAAPSRRTYEELGTSHYGQPSPYYYRGEYDQGEVEGLSEEEVFGKLLEGMNDKGEFTYSGLKDDNTAYGSASSSGYSSTLYRTADNVAPSYNTKSQVSAVDSRINEGTRISTAGSVPQKHPVYAEGPLQETSSSNSYKYSPESQQYYSGSANLNRNSHYSSMATRSSEVSGGVDSQSPLYVGSVSVGAKGPQQYISGSVHKDNNPHGSESNSNYRTSSSTGYYKTSNIAGTGSYSSSDYKAPNSEESINNYKTNHEELPVAQAYTMYDGFKGVQGQNYGNVQLDTKYSVHPQDSPNVQNKQNAVSYSNIPSPQSNQYQGAPQYRDTYDSHSWVVSGLTFTTETPQEMSLSEHVKQEDISKNVSGNVTKVQNITKVGVEDAIPVSSEISSRLSPTLQKRVYGIIEHGPRSLRHRRGVPEVEDERFNEIDSLIPNKINDHSVLPTDQANSTPNSNQEETTTNLKQTESPSTTESTTTIDVSTRSIDYVTTLLNEETTTKGSNEPLFVTTLQSEINTNNEEEMEEADEEESDNDEEDYTATSASTTEATVVGETEGDESVTEASEKFSLMGFFRRIARFKIRLGLNLLRSTSEAFTNYIDRVQKRLDKNDIVKSNARNSKVNSRIKRSADLKATSAGGKKLLEMLKEYHKKHRTPSRSKSV